MADPARPGRIELTAQWIDTAIRPDLHPPPAESASAGGPDRQVQMRGSADQAAPSSIDVHQLASAGAAGASTSLPHLDRIQQSFGHHDVSRVQAHVGGSAAEASHAMGAEAYATGNHAAFCAPPDLHTAAHEAAHVVQQRGGVQLAGGVGAANDRYEQHADAVADTVVAGRSAQDLLDRMAPASASDGTGAVQRREAGQTAAAAPAMDEARSTSSTETSAEQHAHGEEGPHVDTAAPQVENKGSTGGPLSKEKALKVLQDAFGSYKTISAGTVEVLSQDDFEAAWEKIYGKTQYSWDKWVVPKKGGNLNGFAYAGVNYINKAMANTGTVPHEMLHSNTASDWSGVVGSPFNEGATDYLKQYALKKAGLSSPNSYVNQLSVVETWLAGGRSEDQLFTAYLKGGAQTIVADWVDANCKGSWSAVKAKLEASDWAKAKALLGKKNA